MKTYHRGFTLIELLVVIAIIGILSSVVLASLNQSRTKAKDAAAKADLAGVHSQGSLFYDSNSQSYGTAGTACNTAGSLFDPTLNENVNSAVVSAEAQVGTSATCVNDNANYAAAIQLLNGDVWCVDSQGYSGTTTLPMTGSPSVTENIACR